MTAPIIPADQWPEWADRFCWDASGDGCFYGPVSPGLYMWRPHAQWADIPMPAGWDWRVPVLRPTVKESLTAAAPIDLEQFRGAVLAMGREAVEKERASRSNPLLRGSDWYQDKCREVERLLALIDGQANAGTDSDAAMAAEYRRWIDFYHSGGSGAYGYEAFLASMQPTKGEGVADG